MMTELTLARVMSNEFAGLYDVCNGRHLTDYRTAIQELARRGGLRREVAEELVDPARSVSAEMTDSAATALTSNLFSPGFSGVVADVEGNILGIHHNPNNDSARSDRDRELERAFLTLGDQCFMSSPDIAGACAAEASLAHDRFLEVQHDWWNEAQGFYNSSVLVDGVRGRRNADGELQRYSQMPHVGGAVAKMGEDAGERDGLTVFAGVSGVVATTAFRAYALTDDRFGEEIAKIVAHAEANRADILGGCDEDLFAGALDSTLAAHMLAAVCGGTLAESFPQRVLRRIVHYNNHGMRVH